MGFNLDSYETVADRLERFWTDNPAGRILTDLVYQDDRRFVVKCFVWRGPNTKPMLIPEGATYIDIPVDRAAPDATGYAEELVGATPVNKTSALENCETSAIGRALANLGYAPKGQRPSREEMVKVASRGTEQIDEARTWTDRDKVCPACDSKVYDNRDKNRERVGQGKKPMPAFKCSNRSCSAASGEPWISWEASYFDDTGGLIVDKGTGEVIPPPVLRDEYDDMRPF